MNIMPIEKRVQILSLLVEGVSIRSVERIVGCSINSVTKLLSDVGAACSEYHNKNVRGLQSRRVECDEIWSFSYTPKKDVSKAETVPKSTGDVWTWTAIDTDSKMIISYLLGGRDAEYALEFMVDLRTRIDNRIQLTTCEHKTYLLSVEESFGSDADYAQFVKMYGDGGKGFCSQAVCSRIKNVCVAGNPIKELVSMSYSERQNLIMRMHKRHFTGITNGIGKKLENQLHALSLHFMHYNFGRVHKALGVTPAMEAGISNHVWSIEEIARLVPDATHKKRGTYKTKKNISG